MKQEKKCSPKFKKLQCLSQKFHVLSYYDEHGTMALWHFMTTMCNS